MIIDIEKEKSKKVMQNGFSSLNMHLIISWFYTLCDMLFGIYLCLLIPYTEITLSLMCVLIITIIICCLKATISNTIDDLIVDERSHKERKQEFKTDVKNYCKVCEAHVRDKTKHCGQCNKYILNYFFFFFSPIFFYYLLRCTSKFDHHCVWLNNCVGEKNYVSFLILVLGLVLYKCTRLTQDIYLMIEDQNNVIIYICLIIDVPLLIILVYLLTFHIYINIKGISTYDWIMLKRKKNPQLPQKLDQSQGYGQLLSTSKRFDMRSQLSKATQFFPTNQEVRKGTQSQLTQIPSLFTSKPATPASNLKRGSSGVEQIFQQAIQEDEGPNEEEEEDENNQKSEPSQHAQPPPSNCYTFQEVQKIEFCPQKEISAENCTQ